MGAEDIRTDEAADRCRSDGKHGMPGVWSLDHTVRWGQPDRLIGTAKCGPACLVVWDSWLAEAFSVSHGDPIVCRASPAACWCAPRAYQISNSRQA